MKYQELERVFKKHKNGKIVKIEHGGFETDWEGLWEMNEQRSTDNE